MANTTRNIVYPTSSDYVAPLETVFSVMASSTDTAIGVVEAKANRVYDSAAERDAAITSPTEGQLSTLKDLNITQIHNGSTWVDAIPYDAWKTWTPTLGGWTAGSGTTIAGRWAQIGKTVFFNIVFTYGAPTVSGTPTFSLPVAPRANTAFSGEGKITIGSTVYPAHIATSGSTIAAYTWNVGSTYPTRAGLTATVPGTWVAASTMIMTGFYETA